MSSVGFTSRKIDPNEELRVAYQNLTKIQKTIHAIRQCLRRTTSDRLIQSLVTAWLNTVEAKQQIEAVGNELKSRNAGRV